MPGYEYWSLLCCLTQLPAAAANGTHPAAFQLLVRADTAWDYHDETNIGAILKQRGVKREDVFILSKVPAGFGNVSDCYPDPEIVLRYARENLAQLGTDYLDVLLLHAPCDIGRNPCPDPVASDQALWRGAEEALRLNLTRAIGVSNYKVKHLTQLKANSSTVPALNQCKMSIANGHDDETIAYCGEAGIVYESFGALKGCPFSDAETAKIAASHNKSVAQVCIRWALQAGGTIATGTGSNATTAPDYARENLDVFDFALDDADMK